MTIPERRAVGPDAVIKVLVVDDSSAVRRIVSGTLADEPDFTVVGTARDGQHAIAQVRALEPDVVVLDVEMPVLDGLATLPKLLELRPHLPVVMYSTLTERGASATLEALARGAVDYTTKPTMVANQDAAANLIRRDLVPLVRTWGRIEHARRSRQAGPAGSAHRSPTAPAAPAQARVVTRPAPRGQRIAAVLIGSSTGGPNALAEVVAGLPASFPVPILVVQHMPEVFTKLLAERLDARCLATVVEAHEGDAVVPGTMYIAQGGTHFSVRREGVGVVAECGDGPPENFCRPAVDVLFRSAVQVWGGGLLAVMLTGMGSDGLEGSRRLVEAGGTVLAQDEDSSVVWGMPGAVAKAGLATKLLPLSGVAQAIVERTMTPSMRVRVS
jgi:two-component system chemotaxis response regulator CheB